MLFLHATYMLPARSIWFFQLLALTEIQISSDNLAFLVALSSGDLYSSCGHRLKKCPYYSLCLVSNYYSSLLPKIFFLWLPSHWIVSSTLLLSLKSPLSYFPLFFGDLYFCSRSLLLTFFLLILRYIQVILPTLGPLTF